MDERETSSGGNRTHGRLEELEVLEQAQVVAARVPYRGASAERDILAEPLVNVRQLLSRCGSACRDVGIWGRAGWTHGEVREEDALAVEDRAVEVADCGCGKCTVEKHSPLRVTGRL